jgi:prophage regulatory protein
MVATPSSTPPKKVPIPFIQLKQSLASKREIASYSPHEDTLNNEALASTKVCEYVLIRRKEVERMTGLSRSRIYAMMAEGTFPKPIVLGAKSIAWIESEVQKWIRARIVASRSYTEAFIASRQPR